MNERDSIFFQTSIGKILKKRRESLGMTIEQVSTNLKIKIKDIETLEQGLISLLSSPYYAAGFIRSYGKLVKADQAIIDNEIKLLMADAGLDNTRHGLVNLDYLDIKSPSREIFYKSMLAMIVLYLFLILSYHFSQKEFITTQQIVSELNQVE